MIYLGVALFGFVLFGTLCFLYPNVRFLLQVWETIVSSNTFSILFSLFAFWDPYNVNVDVSVCVLRRDCVFVTPWGNVDILSIIPEIS